jgi:hypothetical protein
MRLPRSGGSASCLRRLALALALICAIPAAAAAAEGEAGATPQGAEPAKVQAPADAGRDEPCSWDANAQDDRSAVAEGLDWTRRNLYSNVCATARWFDHFFGDERFGAATASEVGGELSYVVERREGSGTHGKPSLRVRIPLPNLNKRLHVFIDREDERNTIAGPADVTRAGANAPVAGSADVSRVGFGYEMLTDLYTLFKFRTGVRVSGGLKPFAEAQYRTLFWQTQATQWRFSETFFWRRPDGRGETTLLDFEANLRPGILFRWFNDATISQITERVGWMTGASLFFDLGERRAIQLQAIWNGDSGAPVRVANYGPRLSYRQSLGLPWLFGEVYVGRDHPQKSLDEPRISQDYVGVKVELQFGREQELPRPVTPPAASPRDATPPAEPGK